MALALSDLFDSETRDGVMSTILSIAGDVALKVTAWQEGQPYRSLLTYVSQKIADNTVLRKEAIKGGLLDSSEAGWLTLLAKSLYRVDRKLADFADGDSFTFTNSSDEEYTVELGDLVVAHSVTGKTYRNTSVIVIPANGAIEGQYMLADEVGTASDAGPGMITEVVSSLVGVEVTNLAAVLGVDEELDEALRIRCRAKLGSLSPNGPKEAYEFVATTPYFDDGTPCAPTDVAITRTLVWTDALTGFVSVFLATAAGAPSGGDVTIVDNAIDRYATPWCTTATAYASTEVLVPVTYQVWIAGSNLTVAQIKSAIASALAVYFASVPISGYKIPPDELGKLYVEALRTVIAKATPGIIKVAITLPAADLELEVGEVCRLSTVTGTVTVIA